MMHEIFLASSSEMFSTVIIIGDALLKVGEKSTGGDREGSA